MTQYKILENVAVSDSGFLFLPTSGETFTVNECGREIIKLLQQKTSRENIFQQIAADYDIEEKSFERDFEDFFAQLIAYGLVKQI
jgi:PqqD family protein of HPr-rel-A system